MTGKYMNDVLRVKLTGFAQIQGRRNGFWFCTPWQFKYLVAGFFPSMKTFFSLFFFLCAGILQVSGQVLDRAPEAFRSASLEQKPVFLFFAGSDWCLPCIRFEKTILGDPAFLHFAAKEMILLRADFPQRRRLAQETERQNDSLAARYNPRGIFPFFLLLRADQTVLTSVDYHDQGTFAFIEELESLLQEAHMLKEYTRKEIRMGSAFEFRVLASRPESGESLLDECSRETGRIESLLTEFSETSETGRINRHAGMGELRVDPEVYGLLERCRNISRLTDGAFDISSGAIKKLYNFKGGLFALPDAADLAAAREKTGYLKIHLHPPDRVSLAVKGMHLGFGAVGKGYAADRVKALMQGRGVEGGVINASGDLTAWGSRPDGRPWKTGIAHPDDLSRMIAWLPLLDMSIATSGNYIQYFDHAGRRYSHNLDPRTGYPVAGIKSVSIMGPSAELADALATAVTVMGEKAGIHFVNQLPRTHCILINEKNQIIRSRKIDLRETA
jgi:thiamine biosynthesis lipoprotein